jgi:phage-related protein
MPTFSYIPERGAALEETPSVKPLKFGDGYEQREVEGINPIKQVWDLRFDTRLLAEANAIVAFFRARVSITAGQEAFDWTAPDGSVIKAVCRSWKKTMVNGVYASVSARFEQVFE